MTREEFMTYAEKEINGILVTQKNRIMNIVERAWAEGKRNASITSINEAIQKLEETLVSTFHKDISSAIEESKETKK